MVNFVKNNSPFRGANLAILSMKSLSYLNKYFRKYSRLLILGILFIVIQNYFNAKMPVIIGEGTDELFKKVGSTTMNKIWVSILILAATYILFSLIKGFFLFLTRQTIIIMSRRIEFDLKNEIFDKYQELDYSFYKSQSTGDLMNRISEDVAQVRQYLGPGIMYTVNLLISLPFICYQMFSISWQVSLFALLPLPIMTVLIYFVSNRMNKLSKEVQKQQSLLSSIGQETFAGIRVIKAYLQENHARQRFETNSKIYHTKNMRLVRTNALFMPTIALLIGISSMLCIYIGGIYTMDGKISTGQIITFVLFVYNLTWPFASVGWVTSIVQRASASQQRINEFLLIEPNIKNQSTEINQEIVDIEFNNVSFKYGEALPNVLNNLNFKIKKGQTIGVIGRTGTGKTTLIQLLVRQLDPTSGALNLNNKDLKTINLEQYRNELAVVPQDVFLFSDTIQNNILFGESNVDVNIDDVKKVAKDAHVLHNIEEFENKFETILGERGVNLSGGQKQRISISRALIRKPKLLILDDCLSAVDTETESIILANLNNYSKEYGTTTIIVSHRVSSIRNADQILVLDAGSIIESGAHDELLALNGVFKQMHDQQLLELED